MTKGEFGEILKAAREHSGLTRKLVAASTGKSVNLVGHWETGYSEPDINTLFRLCELYRISIDETFCGKRYTKKRSNIIPDPSRVRENIAKNILFYRKQLNFTQKHLAELLKTSISTVSSWERGANSPDIETLVYLCQIFNIDVNTMFGTPSLPKAGETSNGLALSQDEQFIIDSYRSMTDAGRQYIRQTVTIAKDAYARPNEHTAAM